MPKGEFLGEFEQMALWAVFRLQGQGYGMLVLTELQRRVGRPVSIGAIYLTLHRLEKKGYATSKTGLPTSVRGGKAKRSYTVTAGGVRALRESRRQLEAAWHGL